ncbi:hypothetical protein, partial [Lactiplantibacillus plantarum]|uniref:hypothetical protein n=1 Tax=Lactiplantibacillus plantarum TaxID=1590 RepID=UPI001F36208F
LKEPDWIRCLAPAQIPLFTAVLSKSATRGVQSKHQLNHQNNLDTPWQLANSSMQVQIGS